MFPLIDDNIIESKYNKGMDIVNFSEDCDVDSAFLTYEDLLYLSPLEVNSYSKKINIVATNINDKRGKNLEVEKFYEKNINKQKIVFLSVIAKSDNFLVPYYLTYYRIEKPSFEINRVIHKTKPDYIIIFLHTEKKISSKDLRKNFIAFISELDRKPDLIIADIDKTIKINKTKIFPFRKGEVILEKKFNMYNKFYFMDFEKRNEKKTIEKLENLIKNTENYFNKKLTVSLSDIKLSSSDGSPLGVIISCAMYNFLKSDVAVFNNNLLVNSLNKGDVKVKDVYSIIKNSGERLVYVKVRGEKMKDFLEYSLKADTSIYLNKTVINQNNLKNLNFYAGKMYKILTTDSFIKENNDILNYITEFSILNVKLIDSIMWYFRNHKIDLIIR